MICECVEACDHVYRDQFNSKKKWEKKGGDEVKITQDNASNEDPARKEKVHI